MKCPNCKSELHLIVKEVEVDNGLKSELDALACRECDVFICPLHAMDNVTRTVSRNHKEVKAIIESNDDKLETIIKLLNRS